MASPNLTEKQKSSSPPEDKAEMLAKTDALDDDHSPPQQAISASPDLLKANETPHVLPQGDAEMPPEARDNKSSRAVGDSSGTAVGMAPLKSPEEASPKPKQKNTVMQHAKKKILHHLKPKPASDKQPGDNKSSRAVGDSSDTAVGMAPLKSPEEASPKPKQKNTVMQHAKKKILHHLKPKPASDKQPEDYEMAGAAGGSACTATVEPTLKAAGSSKMASNTVKKKKKKQVVLDFQQNLEQNCLAEASQQLLAREEHLFRSESADEQVVRTEDEEERLKKDYETLKMRILVAVSDSLDRKNQETLESAVTAILQEEEQDQRWKEATEKERPRWRPMGCRDTHDIVLQNIVKKRMQQVNEEELDSETLKREVCQMSMLIQNDLAQVVRHVQGCYPPEFGICNMYAQLYHQAFCTKVRQLPRDNVPIEECIFILKQVSNYSNNVLHQEELESHINSKELEPLLPTEDVKSLEEQYLSYKEIEVKTWLSNILKLEEESWKTYKKPEVDDGYFCNLALDVIYFVDEAMKEAMTLLSNRNEAQRILFPLSSFLASYKKSIEELLENQENISEILKAHLFGIKKLREYIEEKDNLPDDLKAALLSTATDLRDSCHKYFLSPIHNELKVSYSKLWTPDWFSEHHEIIEELEDKLTKMIDPLKDLNSACLQELLSRLHFEVMIKYVGKMLKKKLKLKNKEEQETAAGLLCEDSQRINTFFIENGSDKTWLCEILPKVSEVLKVQDSDTLQLELCALLKDYPDLTEHQLCSILQLKTNISCADKRMIKECYHQSKSNVLDSEDAPPFFCRVPRSFSFNFYSCFCIRPTFKGTLPCKNGCQASSPV